MTGAIHIGVGGWDFDPWRGTFYPAGLARAKQLEYAGERLTAIEINSTFYSHQKEQSFRNWAAETPEDFVFTVKGHQLITHIKRLKDVELPLANFFASGVLALGKRLGPFCWQLPPNLKYDRERIETFLDLLPKDVDALLTLAGRNQGLKNPALVDASGITQVRHAIEVRHESFATPEFVELMRAHNVALVTADTAEWPTADLTADFAYCRLQGAPGMQQYEPAEIAVRAKWLEAWSKGEAADAPTLTSAPKGKSRDVFAFFVSTDKKHAPRNAMAVMQTLGIAAPVDA
jgi:uncharacterized protein YecE (DUF72 family)